MRVQAPEVRHRVLQSFIALAATVTAFAVLTGTGVAGSSTTFLRITALLLVATGFIAAGLTAIRARVVRTERFAWACLAAAVAFYAVGDLTETLLYGPLEDVPAPSWADVGSMLFYPFSCVSITLLLRARLRHVPRPVILDGVICALGLSALVAGVAFGAILAESDEKTLDIVVTIAYPIGDLVLLALCVATLTVTRGRPGRAIALLIGGLALFAGADTTHLVQVAQGTYVDGGPIGLLWVLGLATVAVAAWQMPSPAGEHARGRGEHALSAIFACAAVGLLAYGALNTGLPGVAIALAVATLMATAARIALAIRDVQALAESRRLAESDELTGLLNRRGLALRLESALARIDEEGGALSLLLLDLNGFKEVNDTLGHHVGDHLLEGVAGRLRSLMPWATLARVGGDEFVALTPGGPLEALEAASKVRDALELPFVLEGLVTHTRASIGIACCPDHGDRREDLLRHADVAMYRAKRRGTGVELYVPEGDHNSRQRLVLAAELRVALTDPSQLVLHYQPQVDLDAGGVAGVEALLRWQHPEHGLLGPDRFMELAEQQALMHDLTLIVLDRALAQQRAWREEGLDLSVAVNVSAADLLDADFPAHVGRQLELHETPDGRLGLELTEKTVMREPGRALTTLNELSALGVALSLDDFGTGYSSLAHLKRLPVGALKIDRSFVLDMLTDHDDAVIVRSTVELGRSLGLRVVAEGVETTAHVERLRYFGCHVAQGFLLGRPISGEEVPAWVRAQGTRTRIGEPAPSRRPTGAMDGGSVLDALAAVTALVAERVPLPELLEEVSRSLGTLVAHDGLVLYRLDAEDATMSAVHAVGREADSICRERFPAGEGLTGATLREGRTRNVARTDFDPDSVAVSGTALEAEALVCCPLAHALTPLGTLNVYREGTDRGFSDGEAAMIERFAALAAIALRHATPAAVPGAVA